MRIQAALALVCASVLAALPTKAASITEPATVFYGKILGVGSGQPFLVTEGHLTWIIRRADGVGLTLQTELRPLNNGEFSYRLSVPHEALAQGIVGTTATLPLRAVDETHGHFRITVDGLRAQIIGPAGSSFDAAQARRAGTYRLDLVVPLVALDSDGNGLPDWWETKYRLNDPNGDPDHDGRNNLAEYRNGSDPNHDDRIPTLATKEIRVYADGTTVVHLRAVDSDSGPTNLTYTLKNIPEIGALYLRNARLTGSNHDLLLAVGATFSQADVNKGRLVFVHHSEDATALATSFEVTLKDEDPSHTSSTNKVAVIAYRPGREVSMAAFAQAPAGMPMSLPVAADFSEEEQPYVANYLLSREMGYFVFDASQETRDLDLALPSSGLTIQQYDSQYVASYGLDRRHVLRGGTGNDRLAGSMESDIIIGGPGNDTLRGNGGGDLFLLASRSDGNDTIEDFNPAQNDAIDISRILVGQSTLLTDYLQITNSGSNSFLRINFDGTGPFTNMVITLANSRLSQADLYDLVENGHLITGSKGLLPKVSIVASIPTASENGPTSGAFTLTRAGSSQSELSVNLLVNGSAANGVDYRYVPSQVTFPAGLRSISVQITPYVDALTELSEVVEIALQQGSGYLIGTSSVAQVTIQDLMPEITIEALEPVAVKTDQTPGLFLVSRSGVIDRSVLVRLTIGGTAANNTDYSGVPTFVNFVPMQTTALITVTPKTTAVLSNGVEYVQLTARADPSYRLGNPSVARVVIVEEQMTFSQWRSRYFASAAGDISSFANQDSGQTGIRNIFRYAFGLNALSPQNSTGRPEFKMQGNHLTVAFRRPASVTDVQQVVEVSEDLVTWHSGEDYGEEFADPTYANQVEMMSYRAKQSTAEAPKLFMRVRVVYAP